MVKGPVFIRLGEVLFDSKGIRYHTLLYVQRLNSSKLHGSELYKLGAVAYIYTMVQSTVIGTAPQWRHSLVVPETGGHLFLFAFWEVQGGLVQ